MKQLMFVRNLTKNYLFYSEENLNMIIEQMNKNYILLDYL